MSVGNRLTMLRTLFRPLDVQPSGVRHFLEHQLRRKTERRSLIAIGVLNPLAFLAIIGFGLGSLVDPDAQSQLGGISYAAFVGPALLATTAMQGATTQSLWPTAAQIVWEGGYRSALTTPLSVDELVIGHLSWIAVRFFGASVIFTAVLGLAGLPTSWWVVLAPFAAALTALAFAAPATAFASSQVHDNFFPLIIRFVVIPLFLFSGAFFPLTDVSPVVRWVAMATPALHGVRLCRGLSTGSLAVSTGFISLAMLLLPIVAGFLAARVTFRRSLSS